MSKRKITIEAWNCQCDHQVCLHTWVTKGERVPKVCPKCKREGWDKLGAVISVTQTGSGEPVIEREVVVDSAEIDYSDFDTP